MTDSIPLSARRMMAFAWRDNSGITQSVATSEPDRVTSPSYYAVRESVREAEADEFESLTFSEANALHEDGAFGQNGSIRRDDAQGTVILINEHAKHSLEEFLSEVTRAWKHHQARLAQYVEKPL